MYLLVHVSYITLLTYCLCLLSDLLSNLKNHLQEQSNRFLFYLPLESTPMCAGCKLFSLVRNLFMAIRYYTLVQYSNILGSVAEPEPV